MCVLQVVPEYVYDDVQLRFVRDVKGKEVIAQEEGKKLGKVSGVLVDWSGMTVQALQLTDTFNKVQDTCVPLVYMRQVGDVVLVIDETAYQIAPANRNLSPLLGSTVRDSNGTPIGKISELDFNPETGEITSIFYDEYGVQLPLDTNLKAFNLYGVPVNAIISVRLLRASSDRMCVQFFHATDK